LTGLLSFSSFPDFLFFLLVRHQPPMGMGNLLTFHFFTVGQVQNMGAWAHTVRFSPSFLVADVDSLPFFWTADPDQSFPPFLLVSSLFLDMNSRGRMMVRISVTRFLYSLFLFLSKARFSSFFFFFTCEPRHVLHFLLVFWDLHESGKIPIGGDGRTLSLLHIGGLALLLFFFSLQSGSGCRVGLCPSFFSVASTRKTTTSVRRGCAPLPRPSYPSSPFFFPAELSGDGSDVPVAFFSVIEVTGRVRCEVVIDPF